MQYLESKFFKALALNFPSIDIDRIKGPLFEDHNTFVMFDIKDIVYLNKTISKSLTFTIEPSKIGYIEISEKGLLPHVDGYVGCSLNYVLDDLESHTVFWRRLDTSSKILNFKKITDGSIVETETTGFDYKDLDYVCSFKSTKGDSHLIDVRQIHSVEKYKGTCKRKILSYRWDPKYNLDEIYNSLVIAV